MNSNPPSLDESESTRLSQVRSEVEEITDRLGLEIDGGIKEAVVAMRLIDLPTTGSCEGHIDRALPYPWVEVNVAEPRESTEAEQEVWRQAQQAARDRIGPLVESFYADRDVPAEIRLEVTDRGVYGGFRIQSAGGEAMIEKDEAEKAAKLPLFQKEMNDFANFLKHAEGTSSGA